MPVTTVFQVARPQGNPHPSSPPQLYRLWAKWTFHAQPNWAINSHVQYFNMLTLIIFRGAAEALT